MDIGGRKKRPSHMSEAAPGAFAREMGRNNVMPYDSEAIIALGFLVSVVVITAGLFAFIMTRKNKGK